MENIDLSVSDNNNDVKTEDKFMLDRGRFTANGYTFTVCGIYLGEEDDYWDSLNISILQKDGTFKNQMIMPTITNNLNEFKELSNQKLAQYLTTLFSSKFVEPKPVSMWKKIKMFFTGGGKYSEKGIEQWIKWIEKKVEYNGENIKFFDLERKYGLKKSEVAKLIGYIHELSDFL